MHSAGERQGRWQTTSRASRSGPRGCVTVDSKNKIGKIQQQPILDPMHELEL